MRRDAGAFSALALLLLLLSSLHALAEVRSLGSPNAGVICNTFGVARDPGGAPLPAGHADDCPMCLAGACASAALDSVAPATPARNVTETAASWLSPLSIAPRAFLVQRPGIRGPPLSA
ncbi:MAG TPA: hypothetical protein PKE65_04510 [Rhizobiaceae bacterium]|nr:hypothetical protein [Rhizobiaceae bacterium]